AYVNISARSQPGSREAFDLAAVDEVQIADHCHVNSPAIGRASGVGLDRGIIYGEAAATDHNAPTALTAGIEDGAVLQMDRALLRKCRTELGVAERRWYDRHL